MYIIIFVFCFFYKDMISKTRLPPPKEDAPSLRLCRLRL